MFLILKAKHDCQLMIQATISMTSRWRTPSVVNDAESRTISRLNGNTSELRAISYFGYGGSVEKAEYKRRSLMSRNFNERSTSFEVALG